MDDDAVSSAEAVRHPGGEVHPLLQQDQGLVRGDQLLDVVPVADSAVNHFPGVVFFPLLQRRQAGVTLSGDVFRHLVGQGALLGVVGALVLVGLGRHGGRLTLDPAVGAGRAQQRVLSVAVAAHSTTALSSSISLSMHSWRLSAGTSDTLAP